MHELLDASTAALVATSAAPAAAAVEPFERSQDGLSLAAPERLFADYLEMALLSLVIMVGAPLNAITLYKLVRSMHNSSKFPKAKHDSNSKTSYLALRIHVVIIDLIVILVYCTSHFLWLLTYVWVGPAILCPIVQYAWAFSWHLMSIGVVGIAIDRLRTVRRILSLASAAPSPEARRPTSHLNFVKRLVIITYVSALVFSLPQLFVWETVEMSGWKQCTTCWHKARANQYLHNEAVTETYSGEQIYSALHLATVFWLPFIVLVGAYGAIVLNLFRYALRPSSVCSRGDDPSSLSRIATDGDSLSSNNSQLYTAHNGAHTPFLLASNYSRSSVKLPAWRLEMKSKTARSTFMVIAVYLVCWMPYNVVASATFFSSELQTFVSMHLELLRVCVTLSSILNPIIYTRN